MMDQIGWITFAFLQPICRQKWMKSIAIGCRTRVVRQKQVKNLCVDFHRISKEISTQRFFWYCWFEWLGLPTCCKQRIYCSLSYCTSWNQSENSQINEKLTLHSLPKCARVIGARFVLDSFVLVEKVSIWFCTPAYKVQWWSQANLRMFEGKNPT
jgi:hypothetical protein